MSKLFKLILNYPRTVIASTMFFTLLFLWNIPDLKLDPSLRGMIAKDDPLMVTLDKIDDLFGGTDIIMVGVESDSLLWEHTLVKFEALHDSLENIDQISSVTSLYNAPNIISSSMGFEVADLMEFYPVNDEENQELKNIIKDNELMYGNLISKDFRSMAFICQIESGFHYDEHKLKEDVLQVVDFFRDNTDRIYVSGLPITRSSMVVSMGGDMKTFMPFGVALMIVLLAISFRSWLGVFMPLAVVIISIIWTFGMMALMNYELPFIGVLVPVMLIAIANDYGIHIIAHYYEYIRSNGVKTKIQIIKKTLRRLGIPIFLAGVTTVIGFLSLLGHVLPKIKEFGLFLSYGITMAFIFSVILIPSALVVARMPRILEQQKSMTRMNSFLTSWGKFFIHFRQPFILIMIVLLLFIGIGIQRVVVDTNPDKYYHEGSEIRVNSDAIAKMFGGSSQLIVLVEGDIKDPETLRNIDQLSQHLEKNPLISHTFSIADQVKQMHEAFNEGNPKFNVIPDNRNLIAQYLFLYSMTGDEEDIEKYIDDIDEPEHALLVARLKHIKTGEITEVTHDTEEYIRVNFGDSLPMQISGPSALISGLAQMIVQGQVTSLSVSLVIVFIMMSIVFRSLIGGLLSIIPLSSAIILVFGSMGYLGIELNIATAMLSSIMIGVGVDYTLHFLWHLRDHIREGEEMEEAIFSTLRISGKGIIFNAFSVIIGFTVLTLSEFLPVYFFGFLIVMSISMCLFGALAILPALVSWLKPKFLYNQE